MLAVPLCSLERLPSDTVPKFNDSFLRCTAYPPTPSSANRMLVLLLDDRLIILEACYIIEVFYANSVNLSAMQCGC